MKYIHLRSKLLLIGGLVVSLLLMSAPAQAAAPPAVFITEIQTGAAAASDEFVELYNASDTTVDIGGWQVRYLNASANSEETSAVATITAGTLLPARTHYVLHTPQVGLATDSPVQQYAPTLSDAGKVVALFALDAANCSRPVRDAIAWGDSDRGEGSPLPAGEEGVRQHIYRYRHAGQYVDTNNNNTNAGIAAVVPRADNTAISEGATPGSLNGQELPEGTLAGEGPASSLPPLPIKDCGTAPPPARPASPVLPPAANPKPEPPKEPQVPERNHGLAVPQVSELLPNPAKPQTDANDEFVELYNPNPVAFELSGYMLEVEAKAKKRYTFPPDTVLDPKAFRAFMSKDTKLALANNQGRVRLLDPTGRVIASADAYNDAKDGYAWLSADNAWLWTTMPTPGALNMIKAPAGKEKTGTPKDQIAGMGSVKSTGTPGSDDQVSTEPANEAAAAHTDFSPLHPAVLALTGVIAVLYGIYEYRSDLANKLHEFRANRAARRSIGQAAKRG